MRNITGTAALILAIGLSVGAGATSQNSGIRRLDPALDELIAPEAQLEALLVDKQFHEGPIWVPGASGGYLLFSNIDKGTMHKWSDADGASIYLQYPASSDQNIKAATPTLYGSNGMTLDSQHRVVFCAPNLRSILRLQKDGKVAVLADRYEGKRLTMPNDIVYKTDGALYFTDMLPQVPGQKIDRKAELPSAVYMLKNGILKAVELGLLTPNGLAFSPNERYLYVNDSRTRTVWRYDVLPDDTLANGRLFVNMDSDPAPGVPDGIKVDSKGYIYDSGPGGIWFLSPTGVHLGTLATPDVVSNLAFGEADGRTLFITLHSGLYRIRVKTPGIRPG
jgi:gluconolactonase